MFENVCQGTPFFVRHFTRNGLLKGLKERGCVDVTEQIVYDVVKETTPKQHLEKTIRILDENKTV